MVSVLLLAGCAGAPTGRPGNDSVSIWLTSTDDPGGRHVTRGLARQGSISFAPGTGSGEQTVAVDENTRYQQFEGAGASFTDTAAWLMNSSGVLSDSARDDTMTKLFDRDRGIGLDFLRNPMGASDLARGNYTYDDLPPGQSDPGLARFTLAHDMADVIPLTKQAKRINPQLKVMGTPWTAPPWMKDNDGYDQGWLQGRYYPAYAQYFVKYAQGYAAQGIPVDYVSAQNEPTCCEGHPSMRWNGSGLAAFIGKDLLPALHSAGLPTKVLALDWNWDTYSSYAEPAVSDAAIRNDPNFGGVAWHGYNGQVSEQTTVHDRYPSMKAYDTEHSGGTWIADQQRQDMTDIIGDTRNWGRSVVKWSLAVDQNAGPHNGGCDKCTGLITVHHGDSRNGQVDYTIEYYDMGQLTKFVEPGATRIFSTDNPAVPNVAWRNPDGSKAVIAYNPSGKPQPLRVTWAEKSFVYTLPPATSATFTWTGTQP